MNFTYRGIHVNDLPFDIDVYTRKYNYVPPYVSRTMHIPGMDGDHPVMLDAEGQRILVGLYAYGDMRGIGRDLLGWLQAKRTGLHTPLPQALIFDDEPDKRYMGYPERVENRGEVAGIADYQVTFLCPMPYAESVTARTTGISDTNNGTVPTPPVITVTVTDPAGIADLRVELDASNYSLFLDRACVQNDVIVFDKTKRLVTVNDIDRREDLHFNRRWFDIPTGLFSLTMTPSGGIDVEVSFRERFR